MKHPTAKNKFGGLKGGYISWSARYWIYRGIRFYKSPEKGVKVVIRRFSVFRNILVRRSERLKALQKFYKK